MSVMLPFQFKFSVEEGMTFAEKIRVIREQPTGGRKRITGEELGKFLGVTKSTVHNWETGKTESHDSGVLRRVNELWEKKREEIRRRERFWGKRD